MSDVVKTKIVSPNAKASGWARGRIASYLNNDPDTF